VETYIDQRYADLIVAVDGKTVASVDDFLTIIESKKPGDEVMVTVIRDDRRINVPVTLSEDQ
jgi:S1-C subfamily serine protease